MVLGKVCFLYLLSTIFFLPLHAAPVYKVSFDDIVFENDFSKAYKAAAKIFYCVQALHVSNESADTELLSAKVLDLALKDFFYLKLHERHYHLMPERDIVYFVQLHDRILQDIQHLQGREAFVLVSYILIECNKLLSQIIKRCSQYQD